MTRTAKIAALTARLLGAPLAISQQGLEGLRAQISRGVELPTVEQLTAATSPTDQVTPDGIAVVPVKGVLVSETTDEFDAFFGFHGYPNLEASIANALKNPSVKGVVLSINSPGGAVHGAFELSEKLAAWTELKPIHAMANPMAASAAYALAAATNRVTVARSGDVGSVGVVQPHVDQSALDQAIGLKWSFVYAGAKKIDGNPHAPLSDSARAQRQEEVDRLYSMFVKSVAENRNLAQRVVRDTEAGTFMGDAAVGVGFADQVGTLDDAIASLRAEINRRGAMSFQKNVAAKLAVITALGVTEASDEAPILAAIEKVLGERAELAKRAELSEAAAKDLAGQVAKLSADLADRDAVHAIELVEAKAIEAGLAPFDKDVKDDARALFGLGKADLAKRTLDRHLEAARAKKAALSDSKARTQPEPKPDGSAESKDQILAKAKANAAALAEAGKSKRHGAK